MHTGIQTFVTDYGIGSAPLGRAVEERGFDALFVAEHTHIPSSRETPYPLGGDLPREYYRSLEPFVTLTTVAAVTEKLKVGTGVLLLNQRDPITTAKSVASLDLVSGGRFLFGVGIGWNREEMRNHGTEPRTRGALVNERLDAMRQIWTEDEAEFHGKFLDFDPIQAWPKPVQQPHPPIYIGGGIADAVFTRIIEHGTGWYPLVVGPDPAPVLSAIETLRERAGREIPVNAAITQPTPELLAAVAESGLVERVVLQLPTLSEDETLRKLDDYAALAEKIR